MADTLDEDNPILKALRDQLKQMQNYGGASTVQAGKDNYLNASDISTLDTLKRDTAAATAKLPEQLANEGLQGWGGMGQVMSANTTDAARAFSDMYAKLNESGQGRAMNEAQLTGTWAGAPTLAKLQYDLSAKSQSESQALAREQAAAAEKAQKDSAYYQSLSSLYNSYINGDISKDQYEQSIEYLKGQIYGTGSVIALPGQNTSGSAGPASTGSTLDYGSIEKALNELGLMPVGSWAQKGMDSAQKIQKNLEDLYEANKDKVDSYLRKSPTTEETPAEEAPAEEAPTVGAEKQQVASFLGTYEPKIKAYTNYLSDIDNTKVTNAMNILAASDSSKWDQATKDIQGVIDKYDRVASGAGELTTKVFGAPVNFKNWAAATPGRLSGTTNEGIQYESYKGEGVDRGATLRGFVPTDIVSKDGYTLYLKVA
jgi:hypothetical protein